MGEEMQDLLECSIVTDSPILKVGEEMGEAAGVGLRKEIRRHQCTAQWELYVGKCRRKREDGMLNLGPRDSFSRLKINLKPVFHMRKIGRK
jgi:hypothetical protein